MCAHCDRIPLVERIQTPKEYEQTVDSILGLIEKEGFLLLEGNVPLGEHKQNGYWAEDIIYHVIECPVCHQAFTCVVNTYRGGGSFTKGR